MLNDTKNQYLNIIKEILEKSNRDTTNIILKDGSTYFEITYGEYTFCKLKLTGNLRYWLINIPIEEFTENFSTHLQYLPASSSEGIKRTRLFIEKPLDLFTFEEIIINQYDRCFEWYSWNKKYEEEKKSGYKPSLVISIGYNQDTGEIKVSMDEKQKDVYIRNKGKSLLSFPDEYIVIDTETTGLDPYFDELIEVAAIRIKNGLEIDRYQSLIKPKREIPAFITKLTGITNEMLQTSPEPEIVIPEFLCFIGNSVLVAHNAHFDINFLYDYSMEILNKPLINNFVCTLRISRRIFPKMPNHKLVTLCDELLGRTPSHRALQDCLATWDIYEKCKSEVEDTIGFEKSIKKATGIKARDIFSDNCDFDQSHPLFGKRWVFTGTLTKMIRKDAMQIVVNYGGTCLDRVTQNTDYLVMGIQDYSKFVDGEKSNKTKKAKEYISKGFDIQIISENVFYDLINEEI